MLPANETMIEIHDRIPVIAKEKEVRQYLTDLAEATEKHRIFSTIADT